MSTPHKDGGPAFPVHQSMRCPTTERFLCYVDGAEWSKEKCWHWTGCRTPRGYGVFSPAKRKQYRAHRYASQVYSGRAPSKFVLHCCDNPACVNPFHLEEGTHADNMAQMADRRRAAREERHHKAKLSFEEAVSIGLLHRSGDYTTEELARLFGIAQATAAQVASGRLWPDARATADAALAARGAKP